MENKKTDESVKTGLLIEADKAQSEYSLISNEDTAKEVDADKLVHEQQPGIDATDTAEEKDLDELVHQIPTSKTIENSNEVDPDDLVHQK